MRGSGDMRSKENHGAMKASEPNDGRPKTEEHPRRILIINQTFAPVNSIAAIRWTKIGKYLAKNHDYKIDVLTTKKHYSDASTAAKHARFSVYDKTLEGDLSYFNEIIEMKETLLLKIRSLFQEGLDTLNHLRNRGDSREPENSPASAEDSSVSSNGLKERISDFFGAQFLWAAEKTGISWADYDVIISSYGPKWPHRVAKEVKENNPALIWIADYRDSPYYSAQTYTQDNIDFASKNTKLADCILVVAQKEIDNLFLPEGQKVEYVPNGFDPEEMSSRCRKRSGKFYVTYTGTLYSDGAEKRDLTPLFAALQDLIVDNRIDAEDVEVVYCGAQGQLFEEQAEPFPLVPKHNLGLVSRCDSLSLQDESSILVLSTWNTKHLQGAITGKVFEYFASTVPILVLCTGDVPDCDLGRMVEEANAGYTFEEAKAVSLYEGLLEFIEQKYLEWKRDGMSQCPANLEYIYSLGHDRLADKVASIIQETIERRTEAHGDK